MALTVDGGGAKVAKPTTTPEPAAPKAAEKTAEPAPAPKAQADGYKEAGPTKEAPVALQPAATPSAEKAEQVGKGAGDFTLSAADFQATGGANPKANVDAAKDAKYEKVPGQPFIQGAGDSSDIHWNDIDQGGLANCYFMSGMGAVAQQDPNVIRNAIKDNGDGTYTVRFYEKHGSGPLGIGGLFGSHEYKPVDITVTGEFPMKDGQPVFAGMPDQKDGQRELWPAIMEKAYAQYKGSYAGTEWGSGARAMELLTGKDSTEYGASSVTIDQLDKLHREGNALTVISHQNGDKKTAYADGTVVAKHVYMITGVDKDAGMVTIRNPWSPDLPDIRMSIADFNKNFASVASNPGQ